MAWTAFLQNRSPIPYSENSIAKVYSLESGLYPYPVFVKRISWTGEAESEHAIREEDFARKLTDPHICPVVGVCREAVNDTNNIYIVTKAMRCSLHQDLGQRCKDRDTQDMSYPEGELWGYFKDLTCTLARLQEQNLAHRDLKLSNILLDELNQVQLIDFGYAKECSGRAHTLLGSQPYLSPDLRHYFLAGSRNQAGTAYHNPFKSDVYSLGMVLLNLTTFELPLSFTDLSKLQEKLDEYFKEQVQGYSKAWVEVLRRMLKVAERLRPDFLALQYIVEDPLPPNPPQAAPLMMTLRAGQHSLGRSDSTPCLLSIQAARKVSKAIDIAVVLDLNSRDWLTLVQTALSSLVTKLTERSRVTLVSCDKTAKRLCRFIACTPAGQGELQSLIAGLQNVEKTNFTEVFRRGVEAVRWRLQPNSLAQVVLVSDWVDFGAMDPCFAALTDAKFDVKHFAVTCFALGGNSNLSALKKLAQSTCGTLVPVPSLDSALPIFETAFSRICTVAAEDLKIRLTPSFCKLEQVYSHSGLADFYLPSVSAREVQNLVFLLKQESQPSEAVQVPTLQVSMDYIDSDGQNRTESLSLDLPIDPAAQSPIAVEVSVKWTKARVITRLRDIESMEQVTAFATIEELIAEVQPTGVLTELLKDLRIARELHEDPHWRMHLAAVACKWQRQMGCFSSQPGRA